MKIKKIKNYLNIPIEKDVEYKYGKRYFPCFNAYCNFNFFPKWEIIAKLRNKEEHIAFKDIYDGKHPIPFSPKEGWDFRKYPICYIIYWYTMNVLNELETNNFKTLQVKLTIVCSMINKISDKKLSKELKIHLTDFIQITFSNAYEDYFEYTCKFIRKLPF